MATGRRSEPMCDSVFFSHSGRELHHSFPLIGAVLPVKGRQDTLLLPWGRRPQQDGQLPLGGWARLESVHQGRWDKYQPRAVKLPIKSFMLRDIENRDRWYELTRGQWIQGLVAQYKKERRVYIVTLTPQREDALHERWPRIVSVID